jgi:hypothetical protein
MLLGPSVAASTGPADATRVTPTPAPGSRRSRRAPLRPHSHLIPVPETDMTICQN